VLLDLEKNLERLTASFPARACRRREPDDGFELVDSRSRVAEPLDEELRQVHPEASLVLDPARSAPLAAV